MTTSKVFLFTFAPTAAGVAALVLNGRPEAALIAGVAGLVLHWLLTAKPQHDGEMADASYFFGFLLTLRHSAPVSRRAAASRTSAAPMRRPIT